MKETFAITKEDILRLSALDSTVNARLRTWFPEAFKPSLVKIQDAEKVSYLTAFLVDGTIAHYDTIVVRTVGMYAHRALLLSPQVDWKVVKEDGNSNILLVGYEKV